MKSSDAHIGFFKFPLVLLASLIVAGLPAIAAEPPHAAAELMTSVPMDAKGNWDYRLDHAGKLWVAYYGADRVLRLRAPDGSERPMVPEGRAQAPSGLALAAQNEGVSLLWRDKLPTKGLYLADSAQSDGSPPEIGGDSEPLARFRAAQTGDDLLHVLWYGEKRDQETGERYNLYYRSRDQDTGALSPIELVMPGIYPVMSADASGGLMAYSWVTQGEDKRIVARFRPGGEGSTGFADPVTVAEVPDITPIFDAFRSGSRWIVVWLAQYGADRRDFLLEGAHSDDAGKTWRRFAFEDVRGLDIASLHVATDDQGHILLAFSGRPRPVGVETKDDVYLIRSDDAGASWSTAQRLRLGDGESTGHLANFQARNPSVTFGTTPGEVLVAWEDWRDIRSRVYASLSRDYGRTWAASNVALPQLPGKNLGLRYDPNAAYASEDAFHVIVEQYLDDRLDSKRLARLDLTAQGLSALASAVEVDSKARKEALRKRAEGFWQALRDKDYVAAYSYQDPFYRARAPELAYLSLMGRIEYKETEVQTIEIQGSLAKATTRIRAWIPPFKMPTTGETVTQPEREVEVTSTWLWIDGDWYREFRIESQDMVFTRY